jgi:hypothetical protein
MRALDDAAIAEIASASGYWYLATSYSKHPGGLEAAHDMACRAVGLLWKRGVTAFSPIAHGHQIAKVAQIDALDHDFWMKIDRVMMETAEGLVVVRSPGWEHSRGVAEEIEFFRESCLPIYGLDYE